MKCGKEIEIISKNKNFKIVSGAIQDYTKPKSVYVNITSWISNNGDIDDISYAIKKLRNDIKLFFKNSQIIDSVFKKDIIIDLDISPLGLKKNKKTFFDLELNFYQKNSVLLPLVKNKFNSLPELKPILEELVDKLLCDDIFKEKNCFNYHIKKNN